MRKQRELDAKGDIRACEGFLWLPMTLPVDYKRVDSKGFPVAHALVEIRWLEWARWTEMYVELAETDHGATVPSLHWIPVYWGRPSEDYYRPVDGYSNPIGKYVRK